MRVTDLLHAIATAPDDDADDVCGPLSFRDFLDLPRGGDVINGQITGHWPVPGDGEGELREETCRDQLARLVGQLARVQMLDGLPPSPHSIMARAELDCMASDLLLDLASYGASVLLQRINNQK